jgi:agmatinase
LPREEPTFLGVDRCADLNTLDTDIAIVSVPFGLPYDMPGSTSPSSGSPRGIRAQSLGLDRYLTLCDYDFGGELFAGRPVRIADCGDVAMMPG